MFYLSGHHCSFFPFSALCKRPPEEHGLQFGAYNSLHQFMAQYFEEGITIYVNHNCEPGYYLLANYWTDSVCQADGSWDPPPARCVTGKQYISCKTSLKI